MTGAVTREGDSEKFVNQIYLLGLVSRLELAGFVSILALTVPTEAERLQKAWPAAATAFGELAGIEAGAPDNIEVFLPDDSAYTSSLRDNRTFQKTFSHCRVHFEMVEIGKMVVCQRLADNDYLISHHLAPPTSGTALLRYCLDPDTEAPEIIAARTGSNRFTLSSTHPALRFLGVSQEAVTDRDEDRCPGGKPVKIVNLFFGYAAATINAYGVGRRRVLNNGLHRVLALARAGVRFAPMAVMQVTDPNLEMPEVVVELPRDYILNSKRPPLVKDFCDARLAINIRQRRSTRYLDVKWSAKGGSVPWC